jgi:hypothetical protein
MWPSREKEGATMGSRANLADIAHSPQRTEPKARTEGDTESPSPTTRKKAALKSKDYTMLLDKAELAQSS